MLWQTRLVMRDQAETLLKSLGAGLSLRCRFGGGPHELVGGGLEESLNLARQSISSSAEPLRSSSYSVKLSQRWCGASKRRLEVELKLREL
mgnify:CR=1 FL=1